VLEAVRQGVLLGEAAAVVADAVGVLALHAPLADGAVDQALEDVRVPGAVGLCGALRRRARLNSRSWTRVKSSSPMRVRGPGLWR
jgi:hypothetical protein